MLTLQPPISRSADCKIQERTFIAILLFRSRQQLCQYRQVAALPRHHHTRAAEHCRQCPGVEKAEDLPPAGAAPMLWPRETMPREGGRISAFSRKKHQAQRLPTRQLQLFFKMSVCVPASTRESTERSAQTRTRARSSQERPGAASSCPRCSGGKGKPGLQMWKFSLMNGIGNIH